MKRTSRCSERMVVSATGPTSASDGVRTPPVRTTVRPVWASRWRTFATWIEFVTTVRSDTCVRCCASRQVVVPAVSAIAWPGCTSSLAARAIASFSRSCRCDFASKPGSSALSDPRAVAPPCTFSISPAASSTSRSRRIVTSETARRAVSSLTRTAPSRRISSAISFWRWAASIESSYLQNRTILNAKERKQSRGIFGCF